MSEDMLCPWVAIACISGSRATSSSSVGISETCPSLRMRYANSSCFMVDLLLGTRDLLGSAKSHPPTVKPKPARTAFLLAFHRAKAGTFGGIAKGTHFLQGV